MMRKGLSVILLLLGFVVAGYGQGATRLKPEPPPELTEEQKEELRSIPGRAALFSAVLPGLGQAYNKKYWKIPVIYAGGVAFAYFIGYNDLFYQRYRNALFQQTYYGRNDLNSNLSKEALENVVNRYRRNRDYMIIFATLWYGANIIDAYVDAHLKDFDVSDNLSLKIVPKMELMADNRVVFGAGVRLSF